MKSTDRILAVRYARAFYALLTSDHQAWFGTDRLSCAAEILQAADAYMQAPSVALTVKKALIEQVFGADSVLVKDDRKSVENTENLSAADKTQMLSDLLGADALVAAFITVLLEAKRYYLLDACAHEVARLVHERMGLVSAEICTAFSLTEKQQEQVQEALSQFIGKTVVPNFSVDESLLGGLRAKIDDVLIDGSLKRQFERLQEELTK